MLICNLERFVRMCKSGCEREFKEETKGRGVGLRKFPSPWAKGMVVVGRHFPYLRHLKLGMPPAQHLDKTAGRGRRNGLGTEQRKVYIGLLQ